MTRSISALLAAAAAFFGFKSRQHARSAPDSTTVPTEDGSSLARYQTRTLHWIRRQCYPHPGCALRPEAFPAYPKVDLVAEQNRQTQALYRAQVKRKRKAEKRERDSERALAGRAQAMVRIWWRSAWPAMATLGVR